MQGNFCRMTIQRTPGLIGGSRRGRLFLLRFFEQLLVLWISLFFEVLCRDEPECRGVDTVAEPGGSRSVVKDVAQMGIAFDRADFGANHSPGSILLFFDNRFIDCTGETRPSGARIKFVLRTEKRLAGNDTDINPVSVVVPIFVFERRFCPALGGDILLEWCEHGFGIFCEYGAGEKSQNRENGGFHSGTSHGLQSSARGKGRKISRAFQASESTDSKRDNSVVGGIVAGIMEVLKLLGVALGLATLAGVNLYLTVFVTGLAVHMQWVVLPPALHELNVLSDPIIIGVAGFLYLIEFFADKIPWVDTAWDAVHTFIRPVGAAALAVAALGNTHPVFEIVAALVAGGMALTSHVAKAGIRLVANTSPEPVSNIGLSLAEDGIVCAGLGLLAWHPVVGLLVAVIFTGVIVTMMPKLLRGIRAKLWLAWRKLNSPPEEEQETVPGHRLPGKCDSLLRRAHASVAPIEWAAPCLSGGGPRLAANLRGWLVCLKEEPSRLFFVEKGFGGGTVLEMDVEGAGITHQSGFLCDKIELVHRTGSPKYQYFFERGLTKIARRLAELIREMAERSASPEQD